MFVTLSTQESIFPQRITFAVPFKLHAVVSPWVFNVKRFRPVDHFDVDRTRVVGFITWVSEPGVGCWQVPFSVSPSGHSWTVYSTKLLFSGTAWNTQTYDGQNGRTVAPVSSSGKVCLFLEPESNLRRSSRDGLHSQLGAADELSPVGGQGDAGGVHGLVALHRQQEGAGGAGLLELLRGVCVDQGNICTEVPPDQTGFGVFFSFSFFSRQSHVKKVAEVRLLVCSAAVWAWMKWKSLKIKCYVIEILTKKYLEFIPSGDKWL